MSSSPVLSASPAPLHFLLPVKERFTASNAGAVAQVVRDMARSSQYRDHLVLGRDPHGPVLAELPFQKLQPRRSLLRGRNLGLAAAYLDWLDGQARLPGLLEVHGRCHVAAYIAKKRPDLKIALFLHNDPREMRGGSRLAERRWLLDNLAGIFCVSDYIRRCFLDGLEDRPNSCKVAVTPLGVDRPVKKRPPKSKTILLVARMVPEKGVLETAAACADILPDFPEWHLQLVGARGFANAAPSEYERQVAACVEKLGPQAEMTGFIPADEVQARQLRAAISVVPSLWPEPASRAVLEALSCGCALLTTRRGGIPERASGRALLLDDPNRQTIAAALRGWLADPAELQKWQDRAWQDYPFSFAAMAEIADQARADICR